MHEGRKRLNCTGPKRPVHPVRGNYLPGRLDFALQKEYICSAHHNMKMHTRLRIVIIFMILFTALGRSTAQKVVIRVVQDESVQLSNFQTTVKLKKKSFKFQVLLDKVDGIYVFASIRDSIYRFTENSPIRDFGYLKLLELREGDIFNVHRELNISETGWSFWFYNDSASWHSFSPKIVQFDDSMYVCTKMIRTLYDVAANKSIKLRQVDTPLYIFFIVVKEYDADGRPVAELMRRKLKIEWGDEDDD